MAKGLDDLQAEFDAAQAVLGALRERLQAELTEAVLDGDDDFTWQCQAAFWVAVDTLDLHTKQLRGLRTQIRRALS